MVSSADETCVKAAECSIIVPLFNKVELTEACIRAIENQTDPDLYELVVVDNASTDGTPNFCAQLNDDIVVVRNEVNLGFAAACNQGADIATGRNLLFLNNDTEVHAGWLEPLLSHMEDPSVGAVGSKLLFPDGTIQHCGVVMVRSAAKADDFTPVHWLYGAPADTAEANVVRDYQVVTAASVLVRRSTFFELGKFDEGFWNGYEDVDLCLKIKDRGERIIYEPASVITHFESASGPERFRRVDDNVVRLLDRWSGRVTIDIHVNADGEITADPDGVFGDVSFTTSDNSAPRHHIEPDALSETLAPAVLRDREATLELIELNQVGRELQLARSGRDVCWLEGEETNPLVTIRIATFNRGQVVVERAIASALAQTYANIEVLVVGDACDNPTTRAVEAVVDSRVRFLRLPTRGLYPADPRHRWMVAGGHPMLVALDLARGSWIAPCDDDDELTADHVEVLLSNAKQRRLEMVWSKANCETKPGRWRELGHADLQCGHVSHGSVMYSLGLRRVLPNVRSWRIGEPGDWNLWRRMNNLGVRMGFVDHLTYTHYVEATHRPELVEAAT